MYESTECEARPPGCWKVCYVDGVVFPRVQDLLAPPQQAVCVDHVWNGRQSYSNIIEANHAHKVQHTQPIFIGIPKDF